MRHDSSSDVAADEAEDERSITAVAEEPGVTRERAPEIRPGDLLAGRYQIEAIIGKGGSGIVLRAFDRVSATVVAVKVLKTGLTHDPRWEKRFQRELRLGRPIQHPNVCRIFDIGDSDGYRFLTMEYAKGGTLRDLIKKDQPLRALQDRLKDAAEVIAGLAAIHAAGIVHRDVKPDNLLRMDDGRLLLSDFGLATDLPDSTMVSVFVGTPHYMAPEVREGDPATTRSDVWSLGVVLHEIFFGKRPERRASRTASGVAKVSLTSTSSTIERAMLALCLRLLADDPLDRPEDARAVVRLYEHARRSPYAALRSSGGRRRAWLVSAVMAVAFGAIATAAAVLHRRHLSVPGAPSSPSAIARLVPMGKPADWEGVSKPIVEVAGHVHCFSMRDASTATLIWGAPRRAEEIALDTGVRTKSSLGPETYAVGCPQSSGDSLLFTARNRAGMTEVRLSKDRSGSDATTMTPGFDPLWLPGGEEFLYTIDAAHAAFFSIPTMAFNLVPDAGIGGSRPILGKAVGRDGEHFALLLGSSNGPERDIAVYERATLAHPRLFVVPASYEIRFDSRNDELLVSYQLSSSTSTLTALDWRQGSLRNIGQLSGLDLVDVSTRWRDLLLVGRRVSRDAWLYDEHGGRKLTSDGQVLSAAISTKGDVLLGKRAGDGNVNIWLEDRAGHVRPVTHGPLDVTPDFSADGSLWTYADYAKKSIMLCRTSTLTCEVLLTDELLPAWPRFSPDGTSIAYLTQVNGARLMAVSISDRQPRQLGIAFPQCPPVWTSPDSVWGFEGGDGHYRWCERNAKTGTRTGRKREVDNTDVDITLAAPDEVQCWLPDAAMGSPFNPRLRVKTEETSRLVRVPVATPG